MTVEFFISAFVTLVVVVDPVGLAPIFLGVTEGLPLRARRQVTLRAALIAATVLIGSALIGGWLLRTLGIGLPAFRIAGGLLLFSIASEMVLGVRIAREARAAEEAIEERVSNVAAFPLAIPLMAGPGAITATILLAGRAEASWQLHMLLWAVIAVVMVLCVASFLAASRISRLLGVTGNVVLARLLGVLLAALAVQFILDGLQGAGVIGRITGG